MNSFISNTPKIGVRPAQYRDLEVIEAMACESSVWERSSGLAPLEKRVRQVRQWYGPLKFLSLFPNPFQHHFTVYVAEAEQTGSRNHKQLGFIQISPFNKTRSTWRVERVSILPHEPQSEHAIDSLAVGSQLLRSCFEKIWEARTWLLEVDINEKDALALYRHNGFQPLAQMTYWSLSPELLEELAQHQPDLPNLLPISNADAQLLYQLDCVSMPPLLRQVFDRHIQDFKSSFFNGIFSRFNHWCSRIETSGGYVFEPQRKAAIGYYKLILHKDGSRPHQAQLTVHPAYTWLYPQLLAKMAQNIKNIPPQSLELVSADYQHEREEFFEKLGAQRIGHALLMSRSVWHKLKEIKPEGLQLSEVLQSLQPVPRTPIPSRISWLKLPFQSSGSTLNSSDSFDSKNGANSFNSASENGHKNSDFLEKSDNVNPE
jgi:hypothetical protein